MPIRDPESPVKQRPTGTDGERLIAEIFPLLSQQPGLPNDIKEDLSSSDKIFGSRHKRGKTARLEVLENMENRLELALLRNRVAQSQALIDQLQALLSANPAGLGQSLSIPTNAAQAEAVLSLSFLHTGRNGPEFTIDPVTLMNKLKTVTTDEVSVDILRELLIDISSVATAQDIATKHGLGRQAIYDRQNRLATKLDVLIADPDFLELIQYLQTTTCVVRSSQVTASLAHPLVAILLIQHGEFPSIQDLISVAFWGVARSTGDDKRSFKRTIRDGTEWIVC
jgi:hypothetical protein